MPRITKDKKLNLSKCLSMTVKQIKQTPEYKGLTPLGKLNKSGAYHYGNKSTMKKHELCIALSNPKMYHMKIKLLKDQKKKAGTRKRPSRKGRCIDPKRKLPCNTLLYKHEGLTTTGKPCCFKRKMSQQTINKRRGN